MREWAERLRQDSYRPATVRARTDAVAAICRWAGVGPDQLRSEHVRVYLDERGLAAWSRIKYLESVRMWCAFAGIADASEGIRRPDEPRSVPRPCSRGELAALLLAADELTAVWILLAAGVGLRAFEVAKLADEDFTVGPAGLRLRVEGKRGRVDVVPVPPEVAAAVAPFRRPGPLWETTSPQLRARFRRLSRRAGVDVTFHQLRHFYGTETYAATGQDLLMTSRLMRHSSPSTTQGYAATSDAAAAAAVARIPLPRKAA